MERSHCKKEFDEYQENLSKQIDQISYCLSKNNLKEEEKKKCVLDYINKSLEPLFKCNSVSKKKHQSKKIKKNKNTKKQLMILNNTNNKQNNNQNNNPNNKQNNNQNNKQNNNQNNKLKVSLGRFNTPISTNTIGMYINSIKNK